MKFDNVEVILIFCWFALLIFGFISIESILYPIFFSAAMIAISPLIIYKVMGP